MSRRDQQRILIIRLSAIGDVIVTTPVARALREALPDAHLAWVVEGRAREVLAGNPYLDEVIVWERGKGSLNWSDLMACRRKLRAGGRWDWAIDCQGLLRSALVARLSGARRIIGNTQAKERADWFYNIRVPRREDDLSSRQRCLDLLRPLGVDSANRRMIMPFTDADREAAAGLVREAVSPDTGYVCLVPATTWPQKHWFDERWSQVADLLRERLGLTPVVMGAPADVPRAERIARGARSGCVIAAGRTSMGTAAALLSGARVTVSVDTALMHASVAVGTPTVALCGASWWHGFADYENFTLLREAMPCSPCLHRPICSGRFDCMRALTPERVLAAVRERLTSGMRELS